MEPEGLRRCLKELKTAKVKISTLATDQHLMVASMMSKEHKEVSAL
jgi:hypothetical protein